MEWFATVTIERRCAECGSWIGSTTLGHGSLAAFAAGQKMCNGNGKGRRRISLFLTKAHTIRRTGDVVPHPWDSRKATPEEMKSLAWLVNEAKRTDATIRDRLVSVDQPAHRTH